MEKKRGKSGMGGRGTLHRKTQEFPPFFWLFSLSLSTHHPHPLSTPICQRGRVVHPPNGFAQQVGHRQHGQFGERRVPRHRNRVGHNHFLEHARREAFRGGRRQDGVRGAGVDFGGAFFVQRHGGIRNCAGRVNHVVHQHGHFATHVADDVDDFGHVVGGAALVDDGERGVGQLFGKRARARDAADVGGDDDEVAAGNALLEKKRVGGKKGGCECGWIKRY